MQECLLQIYEDDQKMSVLLHCLKSIPSPQYTDIYSIRERLLQNMDGLLQNALSQKLC
jgi:hypothetical protein